VSTSGHAAEHCTYIFVFVDVDGIPLNQELHNICMTEFTCSNQSSVAILQRKLLSQNILTNIARLPYSMLTSVLLNAISPRIFDKYSTNATLPDRHAYMKLSEPTAATASKESAGSLGSSNCTASNRPK
jgi:hypothetical protein